MKMYYYSTLTGVVDSLNTVEDRPENDVDPRNNLADSSGIDGLHYILVKEDNIADYRTNMFMRAGQTLHLYTGHVTTQKIVRSTNQRNTRAVVGGFLEDITFCISKEQALE